jgi:hypothetical protein
MMLFYQALVLKLLPIFVTDSTFRKCNSGTYLFKIASSEDAKKLAKIAQKNALPTPMQKIVANVTLLDLLERLV